jgi:hypothetical protein
MTFEPNGANKPFVPIGLPRILLASAALHLALAGLLVWHIGATSHHSSMSPNVLPSTTLIFTLHSDAHPDQFQALRQFSSSDSQPLDPNAPFPPPVASARPPIADPEPAPAPPPSLALKDSSNARVRLAADSTPSTSSRPHLDPREGIVFLLDISGSMYEPYAGATRLALARQLLVERIRALKEGTPFAVTVYGETALRSGPLVPANNATREAAIQYLSHDYPCGGGTNLPVGLALASELQMGRILLITDGDLNTTESSLLHQADRILGSPEESPGLAIIGIAPRVHTKDAMLLQSLADQQNGSYQVVQAAADPLLTSNKPDVATP